MNDDFPNTNDFLNLFYKAIPYGWLELTLLKANSYPKVYWLELPNVLNQAQLDYLQEQNEYGYNVYFGVTVRNVKQDKGRGKRGDALFSRVLWVDMDDKSDAALKRLEATNPSLIVDSGGGYHGYYLLNSVMTLNGYPVPMDAPNGVFAAADDALFKRTLKGLAVCLDADVKVAEYARIMRLPGFKNMKPERGGALCEVIADPLYTYDFMDLALQYAPYVKENMRVERAMSAPVNVDLPAFIQQYIASGAVQGERNNTFNNMCWQYNRRGYTRLDAERDLAPRARADGLSEHEINATLDSAFREAAPPIVLNKRVAARDKGMVTE